MATTQHGLDPARFLDMLADVGYRGLCTVPCSYLAPLLDSAARRTDFHYFAATSEGEAVSVAAGAWLTGNRLAVAIQNSGFGDSINPLATLCLPYGIPVLLLLSVRGEPGTGDEAHHAVLGSATEQLVQQIGIAVSWLPATEIAARKALHLAAKHISAERQPYCLLVRKGSFQSCPGDPVHPAGQPAWTRAHAIAVLLPLLPSQCAIVTTTGLTGRELCASGDRIENLYLAGAMGCAAGVGLGIALYGGRPVTVFDGDGAALMRLGTQASIAACADIDLLHVVFNNGEYESTGHHPLGARVHFAELAAAMGYAAVRRCDDAAELPSALASLLPVRGARLLELCVRPEQGRQAARIRLALPDIALRLRDSLATAT